MHARLLLVPLFAMLVPVASVEWPTHRAQHAIHLIVLAILGVWGSQLPAGLPSARISGPIVDERAFYVAEVGHDHPVTIAHHEPGYWTQLGLQWRTLAEAQCASGRCEAVVLDAHDRLTSQPREGGGPTPAVRASDWLDSQIGVVAASHVPGRTAYAAGSHVFVVDLLGLSDAFASRTQPLLERRIGHQKLLPFAWVLARFASPSVIPEAGPIANAFLRLQCPPWRELHDAITAPMTPSRAWQNVLGSWERTRLRLDRDPNRVSNERCSAREF